MVGKYLAIHGVLATAAVGGVAAQAPRFAVDYKLNLTTKILCSAVFVSERDPVEAIWNSAHLIDFSHEPAALAVERGTEFVHLRYRLDGERVRRFVTPRILTEPESYDGAWLDVVVDRRTRIVTSELRGHRAKARFWGDQGCVAHPMSQDSVFFVPRRIASKLPSAVSQPWPWGDAAPVSAEASSIPKETVERVLDLGFGPNAYTAAMVILHRGRIVGERYAQGANQDMQLESWSMGKSITSTLLGVLIADGRFKLEDPAPVPTWYVREDDPRQRIRIADLVRMSSGLRFTNEEPPQTWSRLESDHLYVYSGLADVFQHAIIQPVEHPPNTVGRYRNSDPLTLGYLIRRAVEERGEDYLTWPQRALFDRIGIRRQVLEPDLYGNFVLTGYDYGTPRNWARLGLLYLRDGVWDGQRILPVGFVDFVRAPAPAWSQPVYGGQFWLNGDCVPRPDVRPCRHPEDAPSRPDFAARRWNLPGDAYYMAGGGGQFVFVVPSLDLVVVRMGHWRGIAQSERTLNRAFGALSEALLTER